MNYAVMYEFAVDRTSGQFKAPFNQIDNMARVATYKDTAVVTPNSDTPYSVLWFDLRAEPIVVSVPAVEKIRYYTVQLIDGNTFNFGYIGSRATGSDAGDYMVAGPNWQGATPPGIKKVFASSTQFAFAAIRTQLFNPADMPNVEKVQAGYKAQPLSAYLKQPAPSAAPAIDFPKANAELVKKNFLKYLASGSKNINGWKVGSLFGDRLFYSGDWLKRAAAAKGGIYGNDAAEAVYPMTKTLANGEALDSSKYKYTVTFPAGQYPPVEAFWSVTMYDGKSQLLIENPINRYLINSPMLPGLKKNPDGSLTLHIQKDSPGADKESNWLPAPNGEMYLVMRLYWPRTTAPSVLPAGEGSWQPPAIVR